MKTLKAGTVMVIALVITSSFIYGQTASPLRKSNNQEMIYYIPHIPESPWNAQISIYNDSMADGSVMFSKWNDSGVMTHENIDYSIGSFDCLIIQFPTDYEGSGMAVIKSDNANIRVKLSYQYVNSESLCEFFITSNNMGKKWLISNSIHDWFSWFGIAIANFSDVKVKIHLKAFKGGNIVGDVTTTLNETNKNVQISSDFFEDLDYDDIDFVLLESDQEIVFPISITGDTQQSRHVFFKAETVPVYTSNSEKTFYIPHIPESSWGTTFTAYNLEDTTSTFVFNQWNEDGNQIITNKEFSVPANGFLEITSASDFNVNGIGTLGTQNNVLFKMSYRQGTSESLCEFFLSENLATRWAINNSINDWFQWFGLSVANFSFDSVNVTLNAYKDGLLIESITDDIPAFRKWVNISTNIWESIESYDDIDNLFIESSTPVAFPISISGNSAQDRHTFFPGEILSNYDLKGDWVSHLENIWDCCEVKSELRYLDDTYEYFLSIYHDDSWQVIGGMRGSYDIEDRFIHHTLSEVYYIEDEEGSEFSWYGSGTAQYDLFEYVFMKEENFETLEYELTQEGLITKTDKNRDGSYDNFSEITHYVQESKDDYQPGNYGYYPFINYAAVKFFSHPETVQLSVETMSFMSGARLTSAYVTLSGPNGAVIEDIQLAKDPYDAEWEVKNYSMGGYPSSGLWWLSEINITMDDGSSAVYTQSDPHNNCYLLSYVSSNGHIVDNYPQQNGLIEAQDYVCDLHTDNDLFYIETIAINNSEFSDPVIKVYHESDMNNWIAFNDDGGRGGYNSGIIMPLVSGEMYYIKIQDSFFRGDIYSILISKDGFIGTATEQADFPDQYEYDDTYLYATPLSLDEIQSHSLPLGDNDWFVFVAP